MQKYYFIYKKGEKKGPYSLEELRKEKIYEDDLVWNNEIQEWTKSKNLGEVSDIIIIRPPKTPDEIIAEKIQNDNLIIKKIVVKRVGTIYFIFSFVLTFLAYFETQEFISRILLENNGKRYYYVTDSSIFTRSIDAFNAEVSIVGWEYENEALLFLYLFASSTIFFSIFFIPLGFIYYLINKSDQSHYKNDT